MILLLAILEKKRKLVPEDQVHRDTSRHVRLPYKAGSGLHYVIKAKYRKMRERIKQAIWSGQQEPAQVLLPYPHHFLAPGC